MRARWVVGLIALAGCTARNGGLSPDSDLAPVAAPADLAGRDLTLGIIATADLATPPTGCPCAKGSYCDLGSNTCKPGCAVNADCDTMHCDTGTHQCVGVTCGAMSCAPAQVCCTNGNTFTCAALCPVDMGVVATACTRSGDCPHAGQRCCGHVEFGPAPACTRTERVACEAGCPLVVPLASCNTTGEAELCTKKSDCTDAAAPNCCTFALSSFSGQFCVSDTYKMFGTCL